MNTTLSWIKHHELLMLILVVVLAGFYVIARKSFLRITADIEDYLQDHSSLGIKLLRFSYFVAMFLALTAIALFILAFLTQK